MPLTTGGQAAPPLLANPSIVSTVVNTPGTPIPMSFTSTGLLNEVGVRAAAIATAGMVTAANKAVADRVTASASSALIDSTAGGAFTVPLAARALADAVVASASASALAAAASSINTVAAANDLPGPPVVLGLASIAKRDAIAAATAAATYATDASKVTNQATAQDAAASLALYLTAAAMAKVSVDAYDTAVAGVAAGVTKVTKIDFGAIDLTKINPNISVAPMSFAVDFFGTTQFATPFSVNGLNQDGLPAGNLTGIDVDGTGVVFARYSNGGSKALGQVALARFQNNQALAKLGDTMWATTSNSGQPIYGAAGDNNFGAIQSSALEGSNVDLSSQLVKLIISQQAYQANSQTITTEKTLLETILRA
ncbi:MAG: flagellar hook-basal body complex protein [Methylobacter sp.]|nr:flagellar hook-basal body complex protein [Methylobacter sp.]